MTKTILLVDDSPTEMQLMVSALEGKGYHLLTAADGEQALAQAAQHLPDLILLDVVLPKKNGFQVCRQLKNVPAAAKTKIILVSNKNQDSDRFWGLKQGADDYLAKPVTAQQIAATVERTLQV
jgi:twitching motility two-component system response regulator PilH